MSLNRLTMFLRLNRSRSTMFGSRSRLQLAASDEPLFEVLHGGADLGDRSVSRKGPELD